MITVSPKQVAQVCAGQLTLPAEYSQEQSVVGVSTDTRTLKGGECFVALSGENFDGHHYLVTAEQAGASMLIVDQPISATHGVPVLRVSNTLTALQQLSQYWLKQVGPKVIAVTGSVGKTTTKEFLLQIFKRVGATHGSPGNFNNHIGLPLTLLTMSEDTRFLITEMGMNAPGEIAKLAALAEPELGLITKIAPVHLEGLGSIEAIAAAKAELLDNLNQRRGNAILPCAEPLLTPHVNRCSAVHYSYFGYQTCCQVQILPANDPDVVHRLRIADEVVDFRLQVPGQHNLENAAGAACLASQAGVSVSDIRAGLAEPVDLGHRSRMLQLGNWQVIDDCYNASPVAMITAVQMLMDQPGALPRWAVLGDMLELGEIAEALHLQLGKDLCGFKLNGLVTVGPLAEHIAQGALEQGMSKEQVFVCSNNEQAAQAMMEQISESAWILLKGSRGCKMEQILAVIGEDTP